MYWTSIGSGANDNPGKSSATVFSNLVDATNNSTGNHFEILHGGAILQNTHSSSSGFGFISTNAIGVSINGANDPKAVIQYEDANAQAKTTISDDSTFANYAAQGALTLPLSYYQYFGSPQALNYVVSGTPTTLPATYLGDVTVQDSTNWPSNGLLSVDSEYIAYHVDSASTLFLDQRGLCGSSASSHAVGVMGTYLNVVYGCPTTAATTPKFTLDGTGNVEFAQSALAHGQVYMSLGALGSNIQLCPQNGMGLIISGRHAASPSLRDCSGFRPHFKQLKMAAAAVAEPNGGVVGSHTSGGTYASRHCAEVFVRERGIHDAHCRFGRL